MWVSLSERGWAMVGLEALGLSLEDIFITVVDRTDESTEPPRYTRRTGRKMRSALESQVGAELVTDAARRRAEQASDSADDDYE